MKTRAARLAGYALVVGVALVAGTGVTACSGSATPSSNGPADTSTTGPATTATVAPAATTSPPAGTPSPTPTTPTTSTAPTTSAGVENLTVTSAEKRQLAAAYAAFRGIPLSDVAGGVPWPGTVYYAYIPATGSYWALADFEPSRTAPLNAQVGFQDGGGTGMFRKDAGGTWHVSNGGMPTLCGEVQWFPSDVLKAWGLATSPPAGMSC